MVIPGQTVAEPVMIPGVAGVPGLTTTGRLLAVLVPHELVAVTLMLPFCPDAPDVTVILVVPAPEVIVQPGGSVHV